MKDSCPLVSVIVPNYNHNRFLKARLTSIKNQIFTNYEVIILDDCSTDNSLETINGFSKKFNSCKILTNKTNSGSPFKQWAKGIALSKGKFIWIAESDDYCKKNFLSKLLTHFEEDYRLGIVYSDSRIVDDKNCVIEEWKNIKNEKYNTKKWSNSYKSCGIDEINEVMIMGTTINNISSAIFKKSVINEEILETLSGYKYLGDWFFYMTICKSYNIQYVSESLSFYRSHDNNFTLKSLKTKQVLKEYIMVNKWLNTQKILKKTAKKRLRSYMIFKIVEYLQTDGNLSLLKLISSFRLIIKLITI